MTQSHPDFFLYSGSTWEFDATLHDAACNPLDLTGAEIAWRLYDAKGAMNLELAVGDGITVVNATGGVCKIVAPPEQTAALAQGFYRDEIVVTLASGFITPQAVGNIIVQKPGALPVPPQATQAVQDPCAVLAQLQAARIALLTGQPFQMIKIEGFEVRYLAAEMTELNRAIGQYDELCRKASGRSPRRFAIGSGTTFRGPY